MMNYLSKYPDNWPPFGNRFSRWFGRKVLALWGWSFEGDFPNENKVIVAVAPHTSNWDFIVGLLAMFALGFKANWLGKHSLFVGPFNTIFRFYGGLPVDRSAADGVVEQIKTVFEERDFVILALAPEGTRKRVGKLKTGFLRMANAANVPILLVAFDYQKKKLVIGDLFSPTGDLTADERFCYQYFQQFMPRYPKQY